MCGHATADRASGVGRGARIIPPLHYYLLIRFSHSVGCVASPLVFALDSF